MKPLTLAQQRSDSSARCRPAPGPTQDDSQGTNFGPSLRKKKHSTTASTRWTTRLPTVLTPVSRPPAIEEELALSLSTVWSTSLSSADASRLNGGPAIQSCRSLNPVPTESESSAH